MFRMTVQDVFFIRNRGLVATGRVEHGELRVGDEVRINEGSAVRVDAIEAFRKKRDTAKAGDNVGLLFHRLDKGELAPGDVIHFRGCISGIKPDWLRRSDIGTVPFGASQRSTIRCRVMSNRASRACW